MVSQILLILNLENATNYRLTVSSTVLCLVMRLITHYIGVTDTQLASAERVFGRADFVHRWHDHRSHGDIDWEKDRVIFGDKGSTQAIAWTWQDHELY